MRPLAAALLVVGLLAGCSSAPTPADTASPTPEASAPPVSVAELAEGDRVDGVDVSVPGPTQVNYREITIKPGAGTGLHCHYGQLIAVVAQGELTHYADIYPDGVHVYSAGESIVEGAEYVHEGVNEGDEDVVLWVTYITPEGKPLAETDLTKCEQ
ncbi:cupin domain-containing protein [Schumannella luteola]